MSLHIFRNFTVEHLFENNSTFSGYDEFENIPSDCEHLIWLYFLPPLVEGREAADLVNSYLERLNYILLKKNDTQSILIFTLSKRLNSFTKFDSDKEIINEVEHFNRVIVKYANNDTIKIIELDTFLNNYSIQLIIDWKYYYLSQIIINPKLASNFKRWFQLTLNRINFIRKKCIVLDLDNTLWGGILGEDGSQFIKLGGSYPGNAFKDFQILIKKIKETGIILAACSKNNEEDVLEVWDNHPEMILRKNDFSTWRINWKDKAQNIIEIADELNIGTDSIIFFDDNPAERERIKSSIPDIVVSDFPQDPYLLKSFIENIHNQYFKIYHLTDEDLKKTDQYKANIQRNKLRNSLNSIDDFIKDLYIEINFYTNDSYSIPRVAQMTQKTNQFNLTTKRYTENDINDFIHKGAFVFTLRVKDKFGDDGITAAALVFINKDEKSAEIDSFLLSCRILGKKIENIFLKLILNRLFNINITEIYAKYLPTKKNIQTKNFYNNQGFRIIEEGKGITRYYYHIEKENTLDNNYKITIVD